MLLINIWFFFLGTAEMVGWNFKCLPSYLHTILRSSPSYLLTLTYSLLLTYSYLPTLTSYLLLLTSLTYSYLLTPLIPTYPNISYASDWLFPSQAPSFTYILQAMSEHIQIYDRLFYRYTTGCEGSKLKKQAWESRAKCCVYVLGSS